MSHSIRYAQPLQIPDDSVDESDPADNGDGADAENATTSTAAGSAESVAAQTLLIAEVCLLQPRDGVVLVPCGHSRFCGSRILGPWLPDVPHTAYPFAWCCV